MTLRRRGEPGYGWKHGEAHHGGSAHAARSAIGPEALKFGGWQRLNAEYAQQFGVETHGWPTNAATR